MTEIIDEKVLEPEAEETTPECNFATVGAVHEDGLSLIFDGQETASEKHYKCNTAVRFAAGDRVRILKDSGTYVVEYVVGSPGEDILMPTGGADGQILTKDGSDNYNSVWADRVRDLPSGGTTGQFLTKSSNTSYAVRWSDPPGRELPAGGTTGQMLVKTNTLDYQVQWTTPPTNHIPSGGSRHRDTFPVLSRPSTRPPAPHASPVRAPHRGRGICRHPHPPAQASAIHSSRCRSATAQSSGSPHGRQVPATVPQYHLYCRCPVWTHHPPRCTTP